MSSELWVQLSLFVVAKGCGCGKWLHTTRSLGDHRIPRHRFTDKKNHRIWWVVWMVLVFLHKILHLTVLSLITTVNQLELDGTLTKYLAHDCDVGLAEVRRSMRIRPRNFFPNPCGSGVRPHKVFPQAHVECAARRARARTSTGDYVDGDLKWTRNKWTGVDQRPVAKRQAGLAWCLSSFSSFSLLERTCSPPVFPAPPLQNLVLLAGVFRQ